MDQKTAGLWARADDVVRWRRELHKLKDLATALLADLGDMTCYRLVPEQVPDDLEDQVGDFAPRSVSDQKALLDDVAQGHVGSKGAAVPDIEVSIAGPEKEAQSPTPKPKKSRVSYPALRQKLGEQHSVEVVDYAVKHLVGSERNATRLKVAMENFLGTFKSQADAAHAFAESEGELGLSSEEAVALMKKAHHKLTDTEGRVAVWANRKRGTLPNEQPPSKDDPAHRWAERVEEVNAAKEAEPEAAPKPKRKRPSKKVVLAPQVKEAEPAPIPDANEVVEAKVKQAERKVTTKPKTPPPAAEPESFDDFLDEAAPDVEQK